MDKKKKQYLLKPRPSELKAAAADAARSDAAPTAPPSEPAAPPPPVSPTEIIPAGNPMGLLRPVADTDELVVEFKRYLELKEKLLEETDYTWFVRYTPFGADREKLEGCRTRPMAEDLIRRLKEKQISAELEKKIKKSGALKLSKAFGITTEIVNAQVEPAARRSWYRVEASAPNGQSQQRTGYCDGTEKGKAKDPFDSIDATALTRATDRAIMALLGGENTAEEFESNPPPTEPPAPIPETKPPKTETQPPPAETVPPPAAAPPAADIRPEEPAGGHAGANTPEPPTDPGYTGADIPPEDGPGDHDASTEPRPEEMTEEQMKADLDRQFAAAQAAKPLDEKAALQRAVFVLARSLGYKEEDVKDSVKFKFGLESFGDATLDQLKETIAYLETKFNDPLARKA